MRSADMPSIGPADSFRELNERGGKDERKFFYTLGRFDLNKLPAELDPKKPEGEIDPAVIRRVLERGGRVMISLSRSHKEKTEGVFYLTTDIQADEALGLPEPEPEPIPDLESVLEELKRKGDKEKLKPADIAPFDSR